MLPAGEFHLTVTETVMSSQVNVATFVDVQPSSSLTKLERILMGLVYVLKGF
jgi:hypothetical protein